MGQIQSVIPEEIWCLPPGERDSKGEGVGGPSGEDVRVASGNWEWSPAKSQQEN